MAKPLNDEFDVLFKEAVEKSIAHNHKMGLPVYQIKDENIVGIYPDGRVVVLQKIEPNIFSSASHD